MSTQKLKNCAVCGDKALGYNFNAVTCESCKAFFRRNALAKKEFTCPFNQNCEITVVTRRFCQKCRLKKCLDIGMKSENIMSEEDKLIKRRKIETNRAKRRLTEKKGGGDVESAESKSVAADSTGYEAFGNSYDSQSCGSFESSNGMMQPSSSTSTTSFMENIQNLNIDLMTSEEMVEFIVSDPDRASQAISRLMRTPVEAMSSLEKIINSQKDALRLISHLIAYPGDALKIISKIMNSPFNALTVFTKFMSSPTDALEIISKIVSSPQDVLQFIKNLMDSPEDALDIMNKFMNTPAEALKMLNKIFNGNNTVVQTINNEPKETNTTPPTDFQIESDIPVIREPTVIHTMLNNSSPGELVSDEVNSPPPSQTPIMCNGSTTITLNPYTPPIQSPMSFTDPNSSGSIQYHSPSSLHDIPVDQMPSTSAGLISTSPTNMQHVADFPNDPSVYELRSFIQSSCTDNQINDGINSLDSVLTEVIRIEFQAFNELAIEPRIKYEHTQQQLHLQQPQHSNESFQIAENNINEGYFQAHEQPICSPSSVIMGRDLNETEQMKLRELKIASEALFYPVDEDLSVLMMGDERIKPEDTHQDPKLLQVINLTAVAIKRLIKMAKKITAFRDMCQEDQVALLKGGCTEMMIMRSVMTYDDDRNTWKIPHTKENMSNIRAEVLKLAKGNVYEEHKKFISTFDEKWRMDENIILIMCAIVLFSPNRPRIIHSDVIRLEQNSYYYLLRRYLESVYPGCEAKSAFIKLIQKISDVERLNQVIIGVYLNVNPSQVEPLLREIFDLKNY